METLEELKNKYKKLQEESNNLYSKIKILERRDAISKFTIGGVILEQFVFQMAVSKNSSEENYLGMMSQQNLNKIKQNSYGYSFINYNDSDSSYQCSSCYSKYLFYNYVYYKK